MKLKSLKIQSKFRSLSASFEIDFRYPFEEGISEDELNRFHPFCFAGLNGSGKSNVLEALANIFYYIEGCVNVNQPDNFCDVFSYEESMPNAFDLEYFIVPKFGDDYIKNHDYVIERLNKVILSKKEGEIVRMFIQPYPFSDDKTIEEQRVKPTDAEIRDRRSAPAKAFLPNLVIAYSSGENEILSIPFLKTRLLQYDEYKEHLLKNYEYNKPESSLIYIDYEMSQAVLLANLIFNNNKDNGDVLKPIRDELGILNVARFRMNLRPHRLEENKKYRILDQVYSKENEQEDRIINKFKNCSTCYFESEDHLVLDFWINEATKDAFCDNFDGIFDLFQAFQLLYTLNYRALSPSIKTDVYQSKGYYTDGKIPEPSPYEQAFHFLDYYIEKEIKETGEVINLLLKNLSDGEQQFLHSLGICLMLKNRNALLLLDEPETHFNPDWRSKFIRTLKLSLEKSNSNNLMRDIIITSHSPFIISDCLPDNVFIFKRNKEDEYKVICERPDFNTYGTSIDIIMEQIFKKRATIGDLSKSELVYDIDSISDIEEIKKIKKEVSSRMGDSLEKVFLYDRLNRKERQLKKDQNA
ncbi:restriction system-associated AAA family ATPase [Aureispira anguillae]|uniref:Restriction system-associated AAA family ATPase n=1 Tax=Aureispira anguillae TaxID=2864201 RepID=A0A915YKD2_9BACT|nr:restriction system-associated AAA family ATPase [Aureispira anguillae]BDS14551.1 restriction system-associated AAA family ATPase [Aureispira anguillae]